MNFLANETSPYLRQHKDNPVHWQPWGDAAFDQAKALNRPVLLSVGYAACHWCHVMAHESFENEETAGLMNQLFVCIKVDREERPDIDMVYQNALALMGQHGGWPLTMFLTPDREPFWGGTYFPPLPRHGLPGFREVLRGVHESWREQQEKILHNVQALTGALKKMQEQPQGQIVSRELLDKIGLYFLSRVDSVNGGIGDAPKFPSLSIIALLWDAYIRTGSDAYKSAVIQSLTHMCQGGIYDHVGGGFCRYSVDSEWLVPHFEKMLYDNALFLSILSEVYRETQNPLFARRIKETAAWMMREMTVTAENVAAFASSLDADSLTPAGEHAEGAYYVWRSEEITEILGDSGNAFKAAYDITQGGNWEGVNIPNRLENLSPLPDAQEQALQSSLATLRTHRDRRPAPARDDKVLADWNGLAIAGLVRAHAALEAPELLQAAGSAFSFVTRNMMTADGRLSHVYCDDRAAHAATLDDYANMAEAALAFFEVTHNSAYLAQAKTWVDILFSDYWDAEGKGFYLTSANARDLPLRPKTADDTAMPSGNGTMIGVLARLWLLTGEDRYYSRAEEAARAFSGNLTERFFAMSTFLGNCYFLSSPASLVLSGKGAREAFRDILRKISVPRLVVMGLSGVIPPTHPAHSHHRGDGPPQAYACFGRTCLAPVGSGDELRELLLEERAQRRHSAANDG